MIVFGFYSCCCIEIEKGIVIKTYDEYLINLGLLHNEIEWYKKFNKYHNPAVCVPKMLDYAESSLTLQYVGEPITKETVPDNFGEQLKKIAAFLQANHCTHCDILPTNLLVLANKISLIDFGWAVDQGCNPYQEWDKVDRNLLDCVGWNYRALDWPNDAYSLAQIYKDYSSGQENLSELYPQKVTELNS